MTFQTPESEPCPTITLGREIRDLSDAQMRAFVPMVAAHFVQYAKLDRDTVARMVAEAVAVSKP